MHWIIGEQFFFVLVWFGLVWFGLCCCSCFCNEHHVRVALFLGLDYVRYGVNEIPECIMVGPVDLIMRFNVGEGELGLKLI